MHGILFLTYFGALINTEKILPMNKIKFFSTVLLSLALTGITKAQFDYIQNNDIDQLHKRTLIVVVEKPTDYIMDKLNKKKKTDKADTYKAALDEFNKNFAAAVTKYWKLMGDGDVEYKTADELNDISDKKNYVVLFCRSAKQSELNNTFSSKNGLMWWPDFKEVVHDKDFSDKMTVFGLVFLDRMSKAPFYQFAVPTLFPTKADLEYAVNAANSYISYRENHKKDNPKKLDEQMLQENQPNLKDKTLVIRRDWMDKHLTPAEIAKYYPFPIMIAGNDTVDRIIDSADAKYAVAIVAPYDLGTSPTGGLQYVEFAYSPEDGSFLASSGIPDMASNPKNTSTSTANANKPIITKKALLDFCMYNTDEDDSKKGNKKGGKR